MTSGNISPDPNLASAEPPPDLARSVPAMLAPGWSDPGLATTTFLDHDSPKIAEFVARAVGHPDRNRAMAQEHPRDLAVKLFYAVRDGLFNALYNANFACSALKGQCDSAPHQPMQSPAHYLCHRAAVCGHPGWQMSKNLLCSSKLKSMKATRVFQFHALVLLKLEQRVRGPHSCGESTRRKILLRQTFSFLGTWVEREHQRPGAGVLPKRNRPSHGI